ncbi:MAG: metallophosphoesterase [Verrucomicrobiota bacterium]
MPNDLPISRRRLIKTLFCSSVAMNLNLVHRSAAANAPSTRALDFLAVGDFGSGSKNQFAVAQAMAKYAKGLGKPTAGLLLLGDNFYGPMPDGLKSSRWQTGFSEPYPGKVFPGPCWAILGNHDYHDTLGNEQVQLGYAASLARNTRWTMPAKYYRVDHPQVTFLMIDTNWKPISGGGQGNRKPCLSDEEKAAQHAWLETQLASPRAPFTVVCGHHPIYSDSKHGDTAPLVTELGPILEKAGVHLYLCGHDHDLQHLELDGLRTSFVLSGGGGASLYPHEKVRKNSVVFDTFGFSHLSISNQRLMVRHIDPDGKILHAFSKGVGHDWKIET